MRYLDLALEFDRADQPREAAWAYELVLQSPDVSVEIFRNLVALYFSCNDPGYFAAHRLNERFIAAAYERALALTDLAQSQFGEHPEMEAWRLHLKDRVEAVEPPPGEYVRLARSGSSELATLLVHLENECEYVQEVKELYRRAVGGETQWLRYVHSFAPDR